MPRRTRKPKEVTALTRRRFAQEYHRGEMKPMSDDTAADGLISVPSSEGRLGARTEHGSK